MRVLNCLFSLVCMCAATWAQQPTGSARGYVLGPEDSLHVRVLDVGEYDPDTLGAVRVDGQGNIRLPLVGRLKAAGLTVEQLETEVAGRLSRVLKTPEVSVSLAEYRSHPVSILGAVKNPGVYQVTGTKTLYEVLSLAGGLSPE